MKFHLFMVKRQEIYRFTEVYGKSLQCMLDARNTEKRQHV
jgi:hypothetical protein